MKLTKHPLMLSGALPVPVDQAVLRKLELSFEVLSQHAEAFTRGFYDRLFKAAPAVRGMFPAEMGPQREKLFESLKQTVSFLRDPAKELEHLSALGARHVGYGAKAEHYPLVCRCMVGAMAEACGPAWNADLSTEWTQALRLVSDLMQKRPAGAKTA
jgi:nitric oxide dioxygenase